MKLDITTASERCPVLSRSSPLSRDRLIPFGRVHHFERGSTIYLHGAPAERCYVLLAGWAKLTRVRPNGDEALIRVQKQGETLGLDEGLRGEPYRHNASAVTACSAVTFPARVLRETLAGDPEFGKVLLIHSYEVADKLHDQIEALKIRTTIERLAQFLRDYARPSAGRTIVALPFEKTTVAAYLGMKPESLSRALAKLAAHGVRATKDEIEITDIAALDALLQDATQTTA